jgi:ATP-dependent DNA ligase
MPRGGLAEDGHTAWSIVTKRGYEGMVAKDPESPYLGGRTRLWLKAKGPGAQSEHRWQGSGRR